ncbi:MAG TPA: XdhC family protein [Acidobacteriota bacterium]|nr:XdhC family protein [Acidobacteriota bacterium]
MQEVLPRIAAALEAGEPVVLATVVKRRGSLPMSNTAKMLVGADGSAAGTVGGGCLEAEVYAIAQTLLRQGGVSVERFDLTEIEDGLQGHVCGGSVTILTRPLFPSDSTRGVIQQAQQALEQGESAAFLSWVPPDSGADESQSEPPRAQHAVVRADGSVVSDASLPPSLPDIARDLAIDGRAELVSQVSPHDGSAYFVEPLQPPPTALIFGAGHCGRAIGRLAAGAGFLVQMLEDRPAFLEEGRMLWAAGLHHVDFKELSPVAPDSYLVIVTRGHDHDLTILRQVVGGQSAYLGMIGSARKRHLFEKTLRGEGIGEAELDRLRSPMGLAIGADTPEEIAVAVVAEMIAVRRGAPVLPPMRSGKSSRHRAAPA